MSDVDTGEPAPLFDLPDEKGKPWALSAHLSNGPVMLAFYRGYW